MLDGVLDVFGMGEKHLSPAHGDVGRGCGPVLPGPRIDGLKQNLVRVQNVRVGELPLLGKPREGVVDAGRERGVFQSSDNLRVFLISQVAQVALRLEVAKWIERHALASRRYCA